MSKMYTRVAPERKPDPYIGGKSPNSQKKTSTPDKQPKRLNVRSFDYRRIMQLILANPNVILPDEIMLLQMHMGNNEALSFVRKAKQQKQLEKMGKTKEKPRVLPVQAQIKKQETNQKKTSEAESHLPQGLRKMLERLSGLSLSDVKVHKNSNKPEQIGALAYTQGNEIHIAPGQEEHLPHEGWHTVQQKQRRVEPTLQMKSGESVNDDQHLEKEADVMGAKAANAAKSENSVETDKPTKDIKSDNGTDSTSPITRVIQKVASKLHLKTVIQRISQEEATKKHEQKTTKKPSVENDDITTAKYGETSDNVKKIQQTLMQLNYWAGKSGDKASGYFGEVTKQSLIYFQTGYMKLNPKSLYDKNGNYVGCGPSTARSLNSAFKLINSSNVPEYAEKGIINVGNTSDRNPAYSWDIQAGVFNAYVKEAQERLMTLGYKLPKYGADGKWSGSGETYNAILSFQTYCKNTYAGVQHGTSQNIERFEHFNGVGANGKLDKATYNALEKEILKRVNAGKEEKVEKKEGPENEPAKLSKEREIINQYRQRFLNDKSIKMDFDTPEKRLEWYDSVLKEENISYKFYQIEGEERYYSNIINGYGMWLNSRYHNPVLDAVGQGIVDTIKSNIEGVTALLNPDTWYALYLLFADFKYLSDEEKILKIEIQNQIINSVKETAEKIWNGDASVKAYYISRLLSEAGISIIGSKGLGKLSQIAKATKLKIAKIPIKQPKVKKKIENSIDEFLKGSDKIDEVVEGGLDTVIKNGKITIDDIKANPDVFSGKSADEIAQMLKDAGYDVTVQASQRSSSGAKIIKINNPGEGKNITQVQVSPGGGRHGANPYVKISTSDQGIIKIVDGIEDIYKTDGKETSTIIFTGGK